jgi:hypothetical protein
MVFDQIDKLKREYTDKYVVVDAGRPDLARFRGITGRIKTVNMSGRALVEFDAYNNIGWYDIALDFLKVVDQPPPKPAESHEKPAKKEAPAAGAKVAEPKAAAPKAAAPAGEKKLSPIEMARAQGAAKKSGEAPKKSTADILAAARGNAAAAAPAAKAAPPAVKDAPAEAKKPAAPAPNPATSTGKLSTADILAAARANKAAAAAPKAAAPAPAAPAVVEEPAATVVEEAPEPAAEPEVAPEPVAAVEKPAAVKSSGAKPRGTAEILAWCREHDAK